MNDTAVPRDVAYVPAHGVSMREAFWTWMRVAALSFGGPAGQIAVMHRILVEEKRWISESRFLQFRTELFNAWNHTQFSGLFTTARFDAAGRQTDTNFGAYSSARSPRIIQLSLKVVF